MRRGAPTVVLCYHRIALAAVDPHGLAVPPPVFAQHLRALKRRYEVVPLSSVLAPGRRPRVALTFDDGYADNASIAAELLRAAAVPATFFITTGPLVGHGRFWWDELQWMLLSVEQPVDVLDMELGGVRLWLHVRDAAGRRRAHDAVHRRLLGMSSAEIDTSLADVAAQLGVDRAAASVPATVTADELRGLADEPAFSIGAHTVRHPNLAVEAPARQQDEVGECRQHLADVVGGQTTLFAYPFGGLDAVSERAEAVVREHGFRLAVTTLAGTVNGHTNPLRIPRLSVSNWSAEALLRRMDGLMPG